MKRIKLIRRMLICALCLLLCLVGLAGTNAAFARAGLDSAYASTDIYYASTAQLTNISLAAAAIDGWTLSYGQRFSFNDIVGPRTPERGYVKAVNGRGANVYGGGVSQLATTLMLAVRDFGWMSVENYLVYGDKFTGSYVQSGNDAVVTDYNNNRDFAFTSWYDGLVTIEAWTASGQLYVALTGQEGYQGGNPYGNPDSYQGDSYTVVGSGSTPMPSEANQVNNIRLAYYAIDGVTLSYGQKFSFNNLVGPRTAENGYRNAVNGRGVKVTGGGVAQVASTIYLATKWLDNITFDTIRTYGERYTGRYVTNADDAIVTDYNAGTDFAFTYYGAYRLRVSLYEMDGRLYCEAREVYQDWGQ